MRHFKSKAFHFSWALAIILAGAAIFYIEKHIQAPVDFSPINPGHIPKINEPRAQNPDKDQTESTLPKGLNLLVPFTPQAPTANWDELHNEACEEASAIMAHAYYKGIGDPTLNPEFVEAEIAKITEWEIATFGYFLDINTEETTRLLQEFYGLQTKVLTDYSENDLKRELSDGRLILLPANGRLLGNPNFRSPGPPYHMIVIRGYNQSQFLTNDPGTKRGLNYPYSFSTLYKANGDFNHSKHEVDLSKKMVISVWKNK